MTTAEVIAAVRRVSLKFPAIAGLGVHCHQTDGFNVRVTARWCVPDRDTGELAYFDRSATVDPTRVETPEEVIMEVKQLVYDVFDHEFRECWHVDDVRVYEPHPVHDKLRAA